jgi:YrhK-like protein
MRLFDPGTPHKSPRHTRLYAMYELGFTVVDFLASFQFIAGSLLFFYPSTTELGTWLFLVGSVCFGVKPTIRLVREFHLLQLGDADVLAERAVE